MKKILPINSNPYFRLYTHHGFEHAILSTKDKISIDNSSIAELFVKDFSKFKWNVYSEQVNYTVDNNNYLSFFSNKWNHNMDILFSRKYESNDSIELTIFKQIKASAYSNIKIYLSPFEPDYFSQLNHFEDEYHGIILGNFSKDGIYFSTFNQYFEYLKRDNCFPKTMKISKTDDKIQIEFSTVNSSIKKFSYPLPEKYKNIKSIGFSILLGNNNYFDWIFNNYINFYYDPSFDLKTDFLIDKHKNWHKHSYNLFLDTNIEYETDINKTGFTLLEFIKKQITLDRYVELPINDNINFGISDEKGQYFHSDLIYGFDDEKQCFYNLFYQGGYIKENYITYEDFESKRNQNDTREIFVLRYCQDYYGYEISLPLIRQYFTEFLDGKNISFFDMKLNKPYISFGLNAFRALAKDEGIRDLISDLRISHMLLERATCSKDRIEYLYSRQMITGSVFRELLDMSTNILDITTKIRNSIIKYKVSGRINLDTVKEKMLFLINLETEVAKKIIDVF